MRAIYVIVGIPLVLLAVLQCDGGGGGGGDAGTDGGGDHDGGTDGGGGYDSGPTDGGGTPDGGTPDGGGLPDGGGPNPFEGSAGTWYGDGGCDIFSVVVTLQPGEVVLDPFGHNGTVVFSVTATDPPTASASGLEIFDEPDHECVLTYVNSALGLSCTNPNGGYCVENFTNE